MSILCNRLQAEFTGTKNKILEYLVYAWIADSMNLIFMVLFVTTRKNKVMFRIEERGLY